MAAESFARTSRWVYNGTPVLDASGDLCPNNVGGMKVPLVFYLQVAATTAAGTAMKTVNSTNTSYVMPKAGSIIGVSLGLQVALNSTNDKGQLTATVYKNTTACVTCVLTAASKGIKTSKMVAKDFNTTYAFAANDTINVKLAASSTLASTVNAQALAWVEC